MQDKNVNIDTPLQYLKGVGPKKAELLNREGIKSIPDLLYYFPRRYLDRTNLKKISSLKVGDQATVLGKVLTSGVIPGRKKVFEAIITDGSGNLSLAWFKGHAYLKNNIKKNVVLSVTGEIKEFRGLQIVHPEYEILQEIGDT